MQQGFLIYDTTEPLTFLPQAQTIARQRKYELIFTMNVESTFPYLHQMYYSSIRTGVIVYSKGPPEKLVKNCCDQELDEGRIQTEEKT